jgi:hypothetical protein
LGQDLLETQHHQSQRVEGSDYAQPAQEKKPGELTYETPIKRTHCTHGFFGDECKDSGESLTIRIVVDTTEGGSGVPDGEQKGVITMFPLEGGSGVVKVGTRWTMAPPWVSKNVPIN